MCITLATLTNIFILRLILIEFGLCLLLSYQSDSIISIKIHSIGWIMFKTVTFQHWLKSIYELFTMHSGIAFCDTCKVVNVSMIPQNAACIGSHLGFWNRAIVCLATVWMVFSFQCSPFFWFGLELYWPHPFGCLAHSTEPACCRLLLLDYESTLLTQSPFSGY